MMCTLSMGWQVIDSMRMEVKEGGEWGEELKMSVWVCETGLSLHSRIVQIRGDLW